MQKILELNTKALRTGRAISTKDDTGGLWDAALGLNPYVDNDSYRGILAVTAAPTDLSGSVIADNPVAYAIDERGSTDNCYIMGDAGHFYRLNINKVLTDLRSGSLVNSPSAGMAIIQTKNATAPTLYFARQARLDNWDLSSVYPTNWSDGSGNLTVHLLNSTPHHPMHRLFDRVYLGNGSEIAQLYDDGTNAEPAFSSDALDFDKQETITAIGDDGRYLIIATARLVDESYGIRSSIRVVWWDTASDSWSWEGTIDNETAVRAIKRTPSGVFAVCKNGIYQLTYGSQPQWVRPIDDSETIPFDGVTFSNPQAICRYGDGIMFGKIASAFGKPLPTADLIYFNPVPQVTGDISLLISDFFDGTVLAGTRSGKLWDIDLTSAGASGTQMLTRTIPLGGYWHVGRVDVTLPLGVGASDAISIEVFGKNGTVSVPLRTINAANYPGRYLVQLYLPKQITTADLKLAVTMSAGAPAISDITIYGETATAI